MLTLTEKRYNEASPDERQALVDREVEAIAWQLSMLEAGLCVRRAGLIWRLPLCHESYGEGW